jgi:hypothetical protein
MTGSTFISVPESRGDAASLAAAIHALKHNVNQLIASAKTLPQQNLSGAKVFALQAQLNNLSTIVNGAPASNTGLSSLQAQITALEARLVALEAQSR